MSNNLKYNLYNLYKVPSQLLSIPRVNMNVCCDCLTVRLWTNLLSKNKRMTKSETKHEMYKHMSLLFSSIGKYFSMCMNYIPLSVV